MVAPTMGAAGVIPAVLKYTLEFYSEDEERDVLTFLLTAGAIGMLFKRGATISAAEGGCMAEVGSSTAMAAAAFAACMGGSPATIEQAAEIGIVSVTWATGSGAGPMEGAHTCPPPLATGTFHWSLV